MQKLVVMPMYLARLILTGLQQVCLLSATGASYQVALMWHGAGKLAAQQ
jgi:hypothetical protein